MLWNGRVHKEPAGVGPEGSDANACARPCAEQYLMLIERPLRAGVVDVFACFYAGLDDPSEACVFVSCAQTCPVHVFPYAALVGTPYRCGPCTAGIALAFPSLQCHSTR